MKNYSVQRMTNEDYNNYLAGSNDVNIEHVRVEAENAEEAVIKAKKIGYVVNVHSARVIKTEAEKMAEIEAAKEAEAKAKADREAKERAKADAKGMSVEEYRAQKKNHDKKVRYIREVKKMEAEIEKMRKEIERMNAFINNN